MRAPKGSGSGFEIPDGSYGAVCIMVIDCGMQESNWDGNTTFKRQIYVRFELPEVTIPDGEYAGKSAGIGQRYTFSMHKKSNLRRDLQTWRGRPFTDAEAEGFDILSIVGRSCTLQVFMNEKGYNNINLITPYSGSLAASEPILTFDTEDFVQAQFDALPDWIQKKINLPSAEDRQMASEYDDVQSRQYAREQNDTAKTTGQMDDFDDDIPF